MKKETIKELGKLLFDLSKILLAIGILTPKFGDMPVPMVRTLVTVGLAVILTNAGGVLFNKGVKNNG